MLWWALCDASVESDKVILHEWRRCESQGRFGDAPGHTL
jgi:hypothetical protein